MQIKCNNVTLDLSVEEFTGLITNNLLDHMISTIIMLGLPVDQIDMESLEGLFGSYNNVDEERIDNIYRNLKDLNASDEDF